MTWLISIFAALISGVVGLLLAGVISNACVSWYNVSSREGAAGYFVIFTALAGGVAGVIIGLITARLIAANYGPSFFKELGGALGVVLVLSGLAALLCRLLADVPPRIDGRDLDLHVEFRFPTDANSAQPPTATGEWSVQLDAISNQRQRDYRIGSVHTNAARLENDRWIVPTEVFLFTACDRRGLRLIRDGQDVGSFLLPLPAHPKKNFETWSDWLPRQQADGQPWPADKLSYRFRVQKEPPPAPRKTKEEHEAEAAAEKEAEFAAIPADAPVQSWFPYLAYEQPQTERARNLVTRRPNLAQELGVLATNEDARLAEAAMRCIEQLPNPTAEFIAPIESAGRNLAGRLRAVNVTTVEQDPGYHGAADIAIRFSGWMAAVRTLRDKAGGDFTPELKTILELSRVRTDSTVMRSSVCRVASYYLHQWAGIAPLPTDPPPR